MSKKDKPVSMVRIARSAAGLSMAELAARLTPPKSRAFVSRIENYGSVKITDQIAASLAEALNVSEDQLFKLEPK